MPQLFQKDVIIIGAGASGIMLAIELFKLNVSVVLIETGHFQEDEDRQVLNEVIQTGKDLKSAKWGRKRAIGGTTIAWGGQSLPFSKLDFSYRDFVPNSGWPIDYNSFKGYYTDANKFMGIDILDYDDEIISKLRITKPEFDEKTLKYHSSKWAREPNFRKKYRRFLKKNIDVVYNAQVTQILAENEKVEGIVIENFQGKSLKVSVNKLVLSTGAIEATRMLLHFQKKNRQQFEKNSELIGKYFMDHPCMAIGTITNIPNNYRFQKQFNTHFYNNRKYSIRISLSDFGQLENKILNSSLSIMFNYSNEEEDPFFWAKSFIKTRNMKSLKWILKNFNVYITILQAFLKDGFLYKPKADARLVVMAEQEPSLNSFISLSKEEDKFGQEKALINWSVSNKTTESIKSAIKFFNNYLIRSGQGTINYYNNVDSISNDLLSDVNHFMGGTRMSKSEEEGIVDTNLEVWNVKNLFVCSTSVFPTGSHSNPTLTLLALTKRLAHHLKITTDIEK